MGNKYFKYECLVSFVLTVLTVLIAFVGAGIMPGGGSRMAYTDTMEQMMPLSVMFVRHLCEGITPFYSFETALGQNTTLLNAFCVYSPFTIIYFLIKDPYLATMIAIIMKTGMSALFFHLFLQYGMQITGGKAVFFSICYALNGYQCEYMLSINLMDAVYLLPLLMLCLIRAIRTGKCALLSMVYVLCFVVNFYDGFLLGGGSFVAMFVILYLRGGYAEIRDRHTFLKRYIFGGISAVLISMIIILPAFLFFKSNVGFNADKTWDFLNIFDMLYALYFGRTPSVYTEIPYLYCGLAVVLLIPVYFLNAGVALREKRIAAIGLGSLLISIYVKPVYYFLHAFNRPDGFTARFSFLYVFLLVVLAARALTTRKEPKTDQIKGKCRLYLLIHLTLFAIIMLVHRTFGEQDHNPFLREAAIVNPVVLVMWVSMYHIYVKGIKTAVIESAAVVITMAELGGNLFLNQKGIGLESEKNYQSWEMQAGVFIRQLSDSVTKDGQGFRAHIGAAPYRNMNALYGFEGIAQYVSSNYSGVNKLMARMGDAVSSVSYAQTGATDLTDMLFGVRYRGTMQREDDLTEERNLPLFEVNERALPIGFMASAEILRPIQWEANVLENQNRLLSQMCGKRMDVYLPTSIWGYDGQGVVFEQKEEGYHIRTQSDDVQGILVYGIPGAEYERAYAYFQHYPYTEEPVERFPDENEAKDIMRISPADRKGVGVRNNDIIGDSILEMTRNGDQFQIVVVDSEQTDKIYSYVDQYFCYQDEMTLNEAYEMLSVGGWNVERFEPGYICATVTTKPDMPVLFISVPYDKGWTITVDGEKEEIIPLVNDVFMGVYLQPGSHRIEMVYEVPGMKEGKLLATIGVICWLILLMMDKHSNIAMKQGCNEQL